MLQTVHDSSERRILLQEFTVQTHQHRDFVDVTPQIDALVAKSHVDDGICLVYSPHTTAAITINENADPDVVSDLLGAYADVLGDERRFQHDEGKIGRD